MVLSAPEMTLEAQAKRWLLVLLLQSHILPIESGVWATTPQFGSRFFQHRFEPQSSMGYLMQK
jgi:hypothetical protein